MPNWVKNDTRKLLRIKNYFSWVRQLFDPRSKTQGMLTNVNKENSPTQRSFIYKYDKYCILSEV